MKGTTLGPYRLDRELGAGGMGKVYAAIVEGRAPGLDVGARVAVKVVHPHLLETPGFFKRFLREAEVGKAVVHENVVRTFDCDSLLVAGRRADFLVMEYVEGQTLRALLSELDRVPEELCRHIGREVAKGLAAIHAAGVVHRDLKPENVLITGDHHTVKVMDLGVARLAEETIRLSQSGAFVGSVEYAAPEQFGAKDVGAAADLHALGLVLYELATAQHPYRADDFRGVMRKVMDEKPRRPAEINPQLSPFFEELVLQLLDKDPAKRAANAADLAQILDEGEKSAWWKEKAKSIRTTTKRPLRRIRIPRETALYGRDAELTRLRGLYDKAKAGDGQVLLVEGEAGIGKSRLLDEFVGLLQREGEDLNFLWGSYPPGGAATASGAFSTAYREHFGGEALEETLPAYLVETPILVPALAALLRGETTPTGAEPLTKDSLQTVFVHATRGLAREHTTIVLIEDLHFSPEEGRALFASLAMATPGHRILLVGTTRPGIDDKWFAGLQRVGAERMPLARLGPKDLIRLLQDAFHSEVLAQELGVKIALKSDGNPFFAFEIIRGLREGQFITRRDDGTWVTTRVIGDLQIPSSVLDLVNARVADLDDDERNLLDVASCCGFEFDGVLAGDVLGIPRVVTLQRLAKVEKRYRLVRSVGRNYAFDHHQVRDALYGALNERLREEYHASIATALEGQHAAATAEPRSLEGALCVDLCEHFLEGAQGPRALRYLDAALAHLSRGCLNDQAVALASRALAVPGLVGSRARFEMLLRTATLLNLLGRWEAERVLLEEALLLADTDGDSVLRAQVRVSLGWHFGRRSRPDEAMVRLREALDLARGAGDRVVEANATANIGSVCSSLGRFAEAQGHYERSLDLARDAGNRRSEAQVTGNLGGVLWQLGRYAEAQEHHERSLHLSRETGYRPGEASALGNLGSVFLSQGRPAEAREHYERALTINREIGDRPGETIVSVNLANALMAVGRVAEARSHTERALALSREIGDRRSEARAAGTLGDVSSSIGDHAEACARYEQCLVLARETGDRHVEAIALGSLGRLLWFLGRSGEAQEKLDRALHNVREMGDRLGEAHLEGDLGNLFLSLHRYAEAQAHYERSRAVAREIGDPRDETTATTNLGHLFLSLGRVAEAREHAERALALAREIKYRHCEIVATGNLGNVLSVLGLPAEARDHQERCLALARELGRGREEAEALHCLAERAAEEGDATSAERGFAEALALRQTLGHHEGEAVTLCDRGALFRRLGRTSEARRDLEAAFAAARELSLPSVEIAASAHLARLPGGDATPVIAALAVHGDRVPVQTLMDSRLLLWQATRDRAHLAEAKRLLDRLVEHAPPECRETMLANVRLHREIVAAAKAEGL